jgi:hypothetical protein
MASKVASTMALSVGIPGRQFCTGGYTIAELMEVFSVGRATVYRVLGRIAPPPAGVMRRHHIQGAALEIGDRQAAAILAASALMEIRYLARPVRRQAQDASPADDPAAP